MPQPAGPAVTLAMHVQVGRYGGLEEEVEHLKRDKNLLMLELVRLRQQQQVSFSSSACCSCQQHQCQPLSHVLVSYTLWSDNRLAHPQQQFVMGCIPCDALHCTSFGSIL